jgi:ectoine hydroxylase-related dioxygenase (phytanoyl-CoA dioxygenase family)
VTTIHRERVHEIDPIAGSSRRDGSDYRVSPEHVLFFQTHGYLVLRGVLSDAELATIEPGFQRFISGEIGGMGRYFCDMSGSLARKPEEFTLINAMLPRVYDPAFAGNVYEHRTLSIARQLIGDDVGLDYDQLLAKRPGKTGAVFAWHQDLAYWPKNTPDTRTVTCSLALDDADLENGCLRVVPGSHRGELREHRPLAEDLRKIGETRRADREEAHALILDLDPSDEIVYLPVRRGDITVHNEHIVHGSGGNRSNRWRRTYVVAYRSLATIASERRIGFSHSHNDRVNWDTFDREQAGA